MMQTVGAVCDRAFFPEINGIRAVIGAVNKLAGVPAALLS